MDTNKMREAFERTNSRDHRRQPPKGNNYIDPMAQADWESFQKGWQASREAVVVDLPPKISAHNTTEGGFVRPEAEHYDEAIGDCREAIEAQGLKVAP